MLHLPINKVYIRRDRLSKENWDWLRGKVGVPNDGRQFIILVDGSGLLKELETRHAEKPRRTTIKELR